MNLLSQLDLLVPTSLTLVLLFLGEGERVNLMKPKRARGQVEKWLSEFEADMIGEWGRTLKQELSCCCEGLLCFWWGSNHFA